MQEAKRQFFDSLPYYPLHFTSWGPPLLTFMLFVSQTGSLYADSDASDILDRRDVQSILFDNGSSSAFRGESLFRGEFVTGQKSLSLNAYYVKRLHTYVRSQWGATYEDMHDEQHLIGLKGAVFLAFEKYFIQPFVGVDAGVGLFPNKERNLFSHAILGMDFQIAHNFGISARENWGFSNNSFRLTEPFYFRFENASFELSLFWQI